jgi:hypothetical protein
MGGVGEGIFRVGFGLLLGSRPNRARQVAPTSTCHLNCSRKLPEHASQIERYSSGEAHPWCRTLSSLSAPNLVHKSGVTVTAVTCLVWNVEPEAQSLVAVVLCRAFLRRTAELIESALRAPGFGIETGRARDWQHISMAAALRPFVGRTAPAARLEPHHRDALNRCVNRRCGRVFRAARRGWAGERFRHPTSSILDEPRQIFPAVPAPVAPLARQGLWPDPPRQNVPSGRPDECKHRMSPAPRS